MIRYELNPLVSNSSDPLFEDLGTIRRKEPFILAWVPGGSLFVEIQGFMMRLFQGPIMNPLELKFQINPQEFFL